MSTHSTTSRLAAAFAFCDAIEEERQRRQSIKDQETQEKKQQRELAKEQKLHKSTQPRLKEKTAPIDDYVYLIKASNGYYKIGISHNPHKRFKELQREAATWAITLELVHVITSNKAYILEQSFHKRFAEQRVIGEWFILAPLDVEWLQTR